MRAGTSRDSRQQSRLILGNKYGFKICTVDHQKDGALRVDATITYKGNINEVGVYATSTSRCASRTRGTGCTRPTTGSSATA